MVGFSCVTCDLASDSNDGSRSSLGPSRRAPCSRLGPLHASFTCADFDLTIRRVHINPLASGVDVCANQLRIDLNFW